jgi:hypothetical protein
MFEVEGLRESFACFSSIKVRKVDGATKSNYQGELDDRFEDLPVKIRRHKKAWVSTEANQESVHTEV